MSGRSLEALPEVREALLEVQKALTEVREWSGVTPVVKEALPEVLQNLWEGLSTPRGPSGGTPDNFWTSGRVFRPLSNLKDGLRTPP